ncbi:MAG: ester cyclase [Pseudomonadota bacterium]
MKLNKKIASYAAAAALALSPATVLAASTDGASQLDANKALAKAAQDLWASDGYTQAKEILATDYVNHQDSNMATGVQSMDRGEYIQMLNQFRTAFSPIDVTIHSQVAEGDLVSTVWESTVTLRSEFMGVAPTGKQYTYSGISIDRVKDGQIVESWVNWDKFDLFQELGLVTQPEAPAT